MFTEEEIDDITSDRALDKVSSKGNGIGRTKEKALIPLVFDDSNKLHNKQSYNKMINKHIEKKSKEKVKTYFTDLQTYNKMVKKDDRLTVDDVFDLNAVFDTFGVSETGTLGKVLETVPYYAGDPYEGGGVPTSGGSGTGGSSSGGRTYYEPDIFTTKNLKDVIPMYCLNVGDYMSRSLDRFLNPGHSAIVSKLSNGGLTNGDVTSDYTYVIEAIKGSEKRVVERPFKRNFYDQTDINHMIMMYRTTSSTAIQKAVQFARNQLGEPYKITAQKTDNAHWYCSLLVWRAYKEAIGVDLDYNGGYWVKPFDLTGYLYYFYFKKP